MLIDNAVKYSELDDRLEKAKAACKDPLIFEPFWKDFAYRLCWSSNSLEGNTLTLEETVSFIDFDETKGNHKYSEYTEARLGYIAVTKFLSRNKAEITEDYIKDINAVIQNQPAGYRTEDVYVGSMLKAIYYPPAFSKVPDLMSTYVEHLGSQTPKSIRETVEMLSKDHLDFERIHPFNDGNGRTGRIVLNQQLLNAGLLPIAITKNSEYRQAFIRYDKSGDHSLMEKVILDAELKSIEAIEELQFSREQQKHGEVSCFLSSYIKEERGCIPKGRVRSKDEDIEI